MLLCVFFDRSSYSPIGVDFSKDGFDGATEDFGIALFDGGFGFVLGNGEVARNVVAFGLEFCDRIRQLRHRRTNIRQLNNVGLWAFAKIRPAREISLRSTTSAS